MPKKRSDIFTSGSCASHAQTASPAESAHTPETAPASKAAAPASRHRANSPPPAGPAISGAKCESPAEYSAAQPISPAAGIIRAGFPLPRTAVTHI